jgi:hypothetical protein
MQSSASKESSYASNLFAIQGLSKNSIADDVFILVFVRVLMIAYGLSCVWYNAGCYKLDASRGVGPHTYIESWHSLQPPLALSIVNSRTLALPAQSSLRIHAITQWRIQITKARPMRPNMFTPFTKKSHRTFLPLATRCASTIGKLQSMHA